MRKLFFIAVCAFFLSACVTEEGAQKHAAKEQKAMASGVTWIATVYSSQEQGAKTEVVGRFDTYQECIDKAMAHLQEKGYTEGAYSCDA